MIQQFLNTIPNPSTKRGYACDLITFQEFIRRPIETATYNDILLFMVDQKGKYANLTVNHRLAALKTFFNYLMGRKLITENPATNVKQVSNQSFKKTPGLSSNEAAALLQKAETVHERLITHLGLYLGIRINEINALKWGDLSLNTPEKTVAIRGKGEKNRILPLPEPLVKLLTELQKAPNIPIVDIDNHKVSHGYIRKVLRKLCQKAGVRLISPHSLRVTAITNALENGANPIYVQTMGGWSSLEMVMRYDRGRKEIKNSAVHQIKY